MAHTTHNTKPKNCGKTLTNKSGFRILESSKWESSIKIQEQSQNEKIFNLYHGKKKKKPAPPTPLFCKNERVPYDFHPKNKNRGCC